MPGTDGFDEYWLLHDVFKDVLGYYVNQEFSDVIASGDYYNPNNYRHALYRACNPSSEDTSTQILMRGFLFYIMARKARDLHPTMFGLPETNFHDSVAFKPQLTLIWLETNSSAFTAGRRPLRAQCSVRLRDIDPEAITETEVQSLADTIYSIFVDPTVMEYQKGAILGRYKDAVYGYDLRIYGNTQSDVTSVIDKILAIQSHTRDDVNLTWSEKESLGEPDPATVTILGETYDKPLQRQVATMTFIKAELKLLGMRASKLLVCRSDKIDAKPYRYF